MTYEEIMNGFTDEQVKGVPVSWGKHEQAKNTIAARGTLLSWVDYVCRRYAEDMEVPAPQESAVAGLRKISGSASAIHVFPAPIGKSAEWIDNMLTEQERENVWAEFWALETAGQEDG